MALDAAWENRPYNPDWMREVESVSHRPYGTGYFYADSHTDANVTEQTGYIREKAFLATVLSYDEKTGLALCVQRNKYTLGDGVEILTPGEIGIPCMPTALYDENRNPIPSAPHAGMHFYIEMPIKTKAGDILRAGEYVVGKMQDGLIGGCGFYMEMIPRKNFDGITQCYGYHAMLELAKFCEAVQDEQKKKLEDKAFALCRSGNERFA